MRKPIFTNTVDNFKVKVKDVKKNDEIHIAGVTCKVLSNSKNAAKDRILEVRPMVKKTSLITLTLPKNFEARVTTRSFVDHQK